MREDQCLKVGQNPVGVAWILWERLIHDPRTKLRRGRAAHGRFRVAGAAGHGVSEDVHSSMSQAPELSRTHFKHW
jgi:hypothetical protein